MIRRIGGALALMATSLLVACGTVPQQPVALKDGALATRTDRIGVAMTKIPKPDTLFPGANCLLCLGVASAANKSMTDAVNKWTTDELASLAPELVGMLKGRGLQVVQLDAPLEVDKLPAAKVSAPGLADRDYSSLKAAAGIDRLLVVKWTATGVWRNYASYVPTGAPRAVVVGTASLVNLADNKLEWYAPIQVERNAEGEWDEPPKFSGLNNAFYQAIELAKDQVKKPLAR